MAVQLSGNWRIAEPKPYIDMLRYNEIPKLIRWRTNTLQDLLHPQRGSEYSMQATNGPAHSHELVDIDQSEVVVTAEGSLDQGVAFSASSSPQRSGRGPLACKLP